MPAISDDKAIAGFYLSKTGAIFGFIEAHGIWNNYKNPRLRGGTSNITKLLGLSDPGLAVGFYTPVKHTNHAFELDERTGKFHPIVLPGGTSVTATGVNGKGDVVGYMTVPSGATVSSSG